MKRVLLSLLAGVAAVSAFQITPLVGNGIQSRTSKTVVGAGSAYVSTRTGKAERLEQYKGWLENAEMIFSIPGHNISVKQISQLRKLVPEDTKIRVAKNTILKRAIESDKRWDVLGPQLDQSNMWFFVGSDIKGTFDGYAKFLKDNKEIAKTHSYRFGALDGDLLDTEAIEKISKLPGKLDLYTKLAYALKQPSTKLARTLKASPTKLGRAIKLSFLPEDADDVPAAEPAAE